MSLVSSLLDEHYSEDLQYQNCRYFAEKKFKSLKSNDDRSIKNKLGSFLIQKGFTWDMINRVISGINLRD
jgi:SOS response regulatory protein OraA/RecX